MRNAISQIILERLATHHNTLIFDDARYKKKDIKISLILGNINYILVKLVNNSKKL